MAHYDVELEGGLGDIFFQCYRGEGYSSLVAMKEGDTASVVIYGKPSSASLFDKTLHCWKDVAVSVVPYRQNSGWSDRLKDVPSKQMIPFFPTDSDHATVIDIFGEYLDNIFFAERLDETCLIVPGAGSPDRALPHHIVEASIVAAKRAGFSPVVLTEDSGLSAAGFAWLLQRVGHVVCAHSSASVLRFCEGKSQVCLYPQHVANGHIANRDIWGQFAYREETIHGLFTDWESVLDRAFGGGDGMLFRDGKVDTFEAYARLSERYCLLEKRVRDIEERLQGR